MKKIALFATAVTTGLLLACSEADSPAGDQEKASAGEREGSFDATYDCQGESVTLSATGEVTWLVNSEADVRRLQPVESASGAKYQNASGDVQTVFWIKGDQATLQHGGNAVRSCREVQL